MAPPVASPVMSDDLGPARQRILVVDDDPAIVSMVAQKLDRAGYEVLTATTGQHALDVISRSGLPHLAVVDIRMPVMDGISFCRAVQTFSDLPIIMLTAVDEEETVIAAIEQFAEDYVVKPFSPSELVARIGRVLRRIGDFWYTLSPVIDVDEFLAVDFPHQTATVGPREVSLSPAESKLLYILMRNADRVVSTGFLLRRLWPREEVFEDALRVQVHRLRAKLEPDPRHLRYIITERGQGYRFGCKPGAKPAARGTS